MKTLLSLLFLIGISGLSAEEALSESTTSEALRTSTIAKLELDKATFEEALAVVRTEWARQHPALNFPVTIAEYAKDQGAPPLITMSLRDIPFIKALQYIGETSMRRMVKKPDLLTFEELGLITEDWITKSHAASDELLTALGLGKHPTEEALRSAYTRYGVPLADWMKLGYSDGFIVVFAFEQQQEQIAGINLLLSQGFTISKGEPSDSGQPASRPEPAPELAPGHPRSAR